MALRDDIKTALRITSAAYDSEVDMLIAAALADMERVGIKPEHLAEDSLDPMAKVAVAMYVKSRFGYDNDEASRFSEDYRRAVIDLVNSDRAKYMDGD